MASSVIDWLLRLSRHRSLFGLLSPLKEPIPVADTASEIDRLQRQTIMRLARQSAEVQATPLHRALLHSLGYALICISLGVMLAFGLTLLGEAL